MSLEQRTVSPAESNGPLAWPAKDPDDILDYVIDWSARLDGDTITASEWIKPPSGEITGFNYTIPQGSTTTKIWISGGKKGRTYYFTNHITTSATREMDQTVSIAVLDK